MALHVQEQEPCSNQQRYVSLLLYERSYIINRLHINVFVSQLVEDIEAHGASDVLIVSKFGRDLVSKDLKR